MTKHLQKYVDYIKNTGQSPLPIASFDEDWEPIGPKVRRELWTACLTEERDGGIILRELVA